MLPFQKVLVGVDVFAGDDGLTPPNRAAFERALWVAEHVRGTLRVQCVCDVPEATRSGFDGSEAGRRVRDTLDALLAEAAAAGVSATAQTVFGKASVELTQAVTQDGFDLLIVGTREQGRAARLLFGSTAMKLLRHCPCPVWVTRPDRIEEEHEGTSPTSAFSLPPSDILVATDLGETSQDLLDLAVSTAQLSGARLRVLHVVEHSLERRVAHTGQSEDEIRVSRANDRAAAEQALHGQLARTDYRTLPHGVLVEVCDGHADTAIVDRVEEHGVDLVVMGTVARSGLSGLLVGNTAEQLLPQLRCSVLAVKPDRA